MISPKFDVKTPQGLADLNDFLKDKSYMDGYSISEADTQLLQALQDDNAGVCPPEASKYPHLYRWYLHIVALMKKGLPQQQQTLHSPPPPKETKEENEQQQLTAARLKQEAEQRTAKKEAQQRTLVSIEIKPFDVEQDLMALWKKIVTEVQVDGLKWGEACKLAPVAFGIYKIQTTFTMGVDTSLDLIVETLEGYEDEVQSVEITSMNVL